MDMGQQRFTPSPVFAPSPPLAPPMVPPMGQQFMDVHTIVPQFHNDNHPHPAGFDNHATSSRPTFDTRRSSNSNGKAHVSYEGYTLLRESARTSGQEQTWGVVKRSEWRLPQSELEEFVKKQQKKRGDGREQLNSSEMDGFRRKQIDRLIEDRNSRNDPRYEYQLAAIRLERFQVKGQGPDTKVWIVLKRQLRPGINPDPYMPVSSPPIVIPRERIDLTGRHRFESSPQGSHQIPIPRPHNNGPIHFHGQNNHKAWQPNDDHPMIIDDRFVPKHPIGPLGQEQQRGAPQAHHISPSFSDEGSEQFRPGGQVKGFGLKDEKRKAPMNMQRQNSSDSSSASDIEICSITSDETRPTTVSSGRSAYGGERKSFNESPQRKPNIVEHNDRGGSFNKDKKDSKGKDNNNNFQRRASTPDWDDHGAGSKKDKKTKGYHQDSSPRDSGFSDREDRGRSQKDRKYQRDSYHRTPRSHERDEHGSYYKNNTKKPARESRQRPSRSRERDEYGSGHRGEKNYSKDDRHYKTHSHYGGEHKPIQYATREHERKTPRPRGSSITSGSQYTDEDYIVIPVRGSRRGDALPRSHRPEQPPRQRPIIGYPEGRQDHDSRGIGRRPSIFQQEIANKPYRDAELFDDRLSHVRDWQSQRQRELNLELEREDIRVDELVREQLAREEDELIIEHRVRDQMAREESERRIREKAREHFSRTRLAREQPYGVFDNLTSRPLGGRMSTAYR